MYSLLHLLCTFALSSLVAGRTSTFLASDASLSLAPSSVWTAVSNASTAGLYTTTRGASVSFSFAGQQVTVEGSSSGVYTINLDNSQLFQYSRAESGQVFRASDLDPNDVHSLVITFEDPNAVFYLQQVKIAYANSLDPIPSLVSTVASSITPTSSRPTELATDPSATIRPTATASRTFSESLSTFSIVRRSSTAPSSPSSSSIAVISASFGPLADTSNLSSKSSRPGTIAGAVLGSLGGLALLALLVYVLIKRRQTREGKYHDADTGRQRNLSSFSGPVPLGGDDGGVGRSPGRVLGDGAQIVHSDGWAARLARTNSWRKKVDRLSETRRFYNVDGKSPAVNATTSNALAHHPPSHTLMMAESHTPSSPGPPVPSKTFIPSPPRSVDTPSAVLISRPTRSPPSVPRFHVPSSSYSQPSTFVAGLNGSPPSRKNAPLPPPPSHGPPSQYNRLSAQAAREKKAAKRPSHIAQEDYYAFLSSPRRESEDARLDEVMEETGERSWGEEDRPHFFQAREVMPKYSAEMDPRMRGRGSE